jgi:hypothetical protein
MLRTLKLMAIALAMIFVAEPAIAQFKPGNRAPIILLRKNVPPYINPNLNLLPEMRISPSQAAAIAQAQVPGSMVVKVRLKGGIYNVRLRTASSVMLVRVSGLDGSIM